MRLGLKWILWYSAMGIYVMGLSGIYFYNMFRTIFDEQLKQNTIDMVRVYAPTLIKGLSRSPSAITMDEFDTTSARCITDLSQLSKSPKSVPVR